MIDIFFFKYSHKKKSNFYGSRVHNVQNVFLTVKTSLKCPFKSYEQQQPGDSELRSVKDKNVPLFDGVYT